MPSSEESKVDRRRFAEALVFGAVPFAMAGSSAEGAGQEAQKTDIRSVPPVELFVELVLRSYPDARLDAAALQEIRGDFELQRVRGEQLSKFPLANGDGPAYVQRARLPAQ
jgi:hypothetical protein